MILVPRREMDKIEALIEEDSAMLSVAEDAADQNS